MTFKIPCYWEMFSLVDVEAKSLDDAIKLAENFPLPDNGSYVEGSYEVDMEAIPLYNPGISPSPSADKKGNIPIDHCIVEWHASDVQALRPEWSFEKCQEWLTNNKKALRDRSIELGWEILFELLPM